MFRLNKKNIGTYLFGLVCSLMMSSIVVQAAPVSPPAPGAIQLYTSPVVSRGIAHDIWLTGNTYIADYNNHQVIQVNAITGVETVIAGTGVAGSTGDGGLATAATLNRPWGLAVDSSGALYIAETSGFVVRRVDAITGIITTVMGNGLYGTLPRPMGLTFNGVDVFVGVANGDIRKVDGTATGTVVSSGHGKITGLASDLATLDVYFADPNHHQVKKMNAAGTVSIVAGAGIAGYLGDGGAATSALLFSPADVTLDNAFAPTRLYIADQGNRVIRFVALSDARIQTAAGSGQLGLTGDGGPAREAAFHTVSALAMKNATVLLADIGISRVRQFSPVVATVTHLEISPASATIAVGVDQQFTAIAHLDDGSTRVLSNVTWQVGSLGVAATIDGITGVATAFATGSNTVQVSSSQYPGAVSGQATLNVVSSVASLEISQIDRLPVGITKRLSVIAHNADGSKKDVTVFAVITSLDPAIVTAGVNGQVTTTGAGTTTLSASYAGVTINRTITVTAAALARINVFTANNSIATQMHAKFFATGYYTDNSSYDLTSQVAWHSTNSAVATISGSYPNMSVNALAGGVTTIQANLGGVIGSSDLTVRNANLIEIDVSPFDLTVGVGESAGLRVTGRFSDNTKQDLTYQVIWSSSNTAIASVGNIAGDMSRITGQGAGSAVITATFGNTLLHSVSDSINVNVNNSTLSAVEVSPFINQIAAGTEKKFYATGIYSDGRKKDLTYQVSWSSSVGGLIGISNDPASKGVATGLLLGLSSVKATYVDANGTTTGIANITVSNALLTKVELSAKSNGPLLYVGQKYSFRGVGIFNDGTKQDVTQQLQWTSSNDTVGQVSSSGTMTAIAAGTFTIKAEDGFGGLSNVSNVTVIDVPVVPVGLTVTKAVASLPVGQKNRMRAMMTYSDGSMEDISWKALWRTNNPRVAAVGNNWPGIATAVGLSAGTVTIGAYFEGFQDSATMNVNPSVMTSIVVFQTWGGQSPLPVGTDQRYQALAQYADGSKFDVSADAVWGSIDPTHAPIGNGGISNARQSSLGATVNASFSATLGGITGSGFHQISAATLSSVEVTPAAGSIPLMLDQKFTVTGVYTDGTRVNLTNKAIWTTNDPLAGEIGNIGTFTSRVYGSIPAVMNVTGQVGALSATVPFTVRNASLTDITLSPVNATVVAGDVLPYVATGTFSDGTTANLTYKVKWKSSDPAVAAIGSTWPFVGKAETRLAGFTTISAEFTDEAHVVVVTPSNNTGLTVLP